MSAGIMDARAVVAGVAAHYGLALADLTGRSRLATIVPVRALAAWVLAERTKARRSAGAREAGLSNVAIGRLLGGRDHSTVSNLLKRAAHYRGIDAEYRALGDALVRRGTVPLSAKLVAAAQRHPAALLKQIKPKNELADDDTDARARLRGTDALIAAIRREHGARCLPVAGQSPAAKPLARAA